MMKRHAALFAAALAASVTVAACAGAPRASPGSLTDEELARPPSSAASVAPPSSVSSAPQAAASGAGKNGVPSQIVARHVLIQWMGCRQAPASIVRTRDQARKAIDEVLVHAKNGDDFARLAMEYSDEPGAAARGGSLGRFGKGTMDKTFEETAFGLAIGEISAVIETPFGFHVIQRTE